MSLWSKVNHIRKLAGHIVCKFGRGGFPFFIDYKSYTIVPGVAVPQDFLKVLLECEFRVKSDTQKFHLMMDFEPLAIQF